MAGMHRPALIVRPAEPRRACVEVRVLGPLELWVDGDRRELVGGNERRLLALLAASAPEVVSSDRIVDTLWPDRPADAAARMLHVHVSRLRTRLGEARDALVTRRPGYALELDALDARRFEALLERARQSDTARAAELLREALALWRGEPYADVVPEAWIAGEMGRLDELRLAAIEERLDGELALGRHRAVVAELDALVERHPLRERLRAQHMLALYRCGRQTEALDSYRSLRATLVDELGIEPGEELRALEHRILNHDPSLRAPALARARRRRGRLAAIGVAATVLLAGALALLRPGPDPRANSLAVLDARSGDVRAVVGVGRSPGELAVVPGPLIAVTSGAERTLAFVDPAARAVRQTIGTGLRPAFVTAGTGELTSVTIVGALADKGLWLYKRGEEPYEAGRGECVADPGPPGAIRAGAAGMYVLLCGQLSWLPMDRGWGYWPLALRQDVALPGLVSAPLALAGGRVWATSTLPPGLAGVAHPARERPISVRLPRVPLALQAAGDRLWALTAAELIALDARSARVERRIPLAGGHTLALAGGTLWVGTATGTLLGLDARTGAPRIRRDLGRPVADLAVLRGELWASLD